LFVKAQSDLPYAKAAAEMLFGKDAIAQTSTQDPAAIQRRKHFEHRARSLDAALSEQGAKNILEIAAGLTFRGLAMTARESLTYFDTDLPELIAVKSDLISRLHSDPLVGTLRAAALDALDADAFGNLVSEMPSGEIAVIHEGLLMYLDENEKARLAATVRKTLLARGGAWITADIYVRSETHLLRTPAVEKFLADHKVEENKFADWNAAEAFFAKSGFTIAKRLAPPNDSWRVRETWTLTARP
jgi:O-methyltransferase involved in polyketide biosynthesis